MTALLHFQDVDFSYAERPVLKRATLTLYEGTCAALIGVNGAGKSTLLRLASGGIAASAGRVSLLEKKPSEIPARERSKLVALVPQHLEIMFDFTVQQIVEQGRTPYLGRLRGMSKEDHKAIDRALDLTDTFALRHRIFNELSGGERQRVKIALGLAQGAKLLLLDEPTQNLDIGRQAELIKLLHRLIYEGITVLASIHDLHLIPGNFSMVHLIEASGSLLSGTPKEVLTSENLTKAFRCDSGLHTLVDGRSAFLEVM